MVDVDVDFEVDRASIQSTIETLKRRLEDGMEEGLNDTLEAGKEEAQATVSQRRRPYTTPHLHSSFDSHTIGHDRGFITNPLEHAAYVDQGVSGTQRPRDTPFAYTDSMPPLEEMIQFVEKRMGGWDLDDDLGGYSFAGSGDNTDGRDSFIPTRFDTDDYEGGSADPLDLAEDQVVYVNDEDKFGRINEIEFDDYGRVDGVRVIFGEDDDINLDLSDFVIADPQTGLNDDRHQYQPEMGIDAILEGEYVRLHYRRQEYLDGTLQKRFPDRDYHLVDTDDGVVEAYKENIRDWGTRGTVPENLEIDEAVYDRSYDAFGFVDEFIEDPETGDITAAEIRYAYGGGTDTIGFSELEKVDPDDDIAVLRDDFSIGDRPFSFDEDDINYDAREYAREFDKYDLLVSDRDGEIWRIVQEDEDEGYYISNGETIKFVSYNEAGTEYDHSKLDRDLQPQQVDYTEAFNKLYENFANDSEDITELSELESGDIVEVELVRDAKAYVQVNPEIETDNDGLYGEVVGYSGTNFDGKLVKNQNYNAGIEQQIIVNNFERVWKKEDLESKPYFDGEATEEKLEELAGAVKSTSDRWYKGDVNPRNIEKGDEVALYYPEEDEYRKRFVVSANEDSIDFYDKTYKSDSVSSYSFVGDDREIKAYTKNTTTHQQLSEDQEILINTDNLNTPFDGIVYAKIKEKVGNTRLTISRRFGQKEHTITITKPDLLATREERPGAWDIKNTDITFSDNSYRAKIRFQEKGSSENYSKIRNVIITEADDDTTYENESISAKFYDENGNLRRTALDATQKDVIELNEQVDPTEITKAPKSDLEIDSDFQETDWVVETNFKGLDKSKVDIGDTVLYYDKRLQEFQTGDIDDRGVTGDPYINKNGTTIRTSYGSERPKDSSRALIVSKADTDKFGTVSDPPTKSNGRPKFFYGQEIEFELDGDTYNAFLTDWNDKYISVEGTEVVDKIPLKPTFDATNKAKLKDYQSWSSLSPSEKLDQLENEWKFGKEYRYQSEEFVENFGKKVRTELTSSFKDIEEVRNMTARVDILSQFESSGTRGSINTNGGIESGYTYRLKSSDQISGFSGLRTSTFHHEFEHVYVQSKGYDHSGKSSRYAGNWNGYRNNPKYNLDGTLKSSDKPTEDLGPMMMRNVREGEDPTDLGNTTDFKDVDLEYNFFKNFEPKNLENSEFDDSYSLRDIALEKGEEYDIIRFDEDRKVQTGVITKVKDKSIIVDVPETGNSIEIIDSVQVDSFIGIKKTDDPELDIKNPDSDWEPTSVDKNDRYLEAANRSLKRRVWSVSEDKLQDKLEIKRAYHTANGHETVTGVAEITQARGDFENMAKQLPILYEHHPHLVEAHLEIHNPSPAAKKVIKENTSLDELEEYL